MWLLWASVAVAAAPSVTVTWTSHRATLAVVPPEGEELALDSPVDAELRWRDRRLVYEGTGADLPLEIRDVRGARVEADLTVSLCEKATGVCRPVTLALHADIPELRKGALIMAVDPPRSVAPEPAHEAPAFRTDAAQIAEEAFARAGREGKRVLLDFGAVWCPPCNLLSAEVLHAEPAPPELQGVVVAMLDVDDPRSWTLKDRYGVGGYPTLVVAEPDGTEVSRSVGYAGREAFLSWLSAAVAQEAPDADLRSLEPAALAPEEAAEVAWKLVQRGEEAAAFVARAEEGEPGLPLRLARVQVRPNVDDARWLAEHAPERTLDWAYGARALADDAEGAEVLRGAITARLSGLHGPQVADALYLLAGLPGADAPTLYAAAAASLRSTFTGDPARDRGHYTWLAQLMEKAGDVAGALAFLDEAAARWPDEPTFHMSAGAMLLRADRPEEALQHTEIALRHAWGDNALRAAADHCKVLVALDRAEEAHAVAERVLADVPAPADDLEVRTHRYRKALAGYVKAP